MDRFALCIAGAIASVVLMAPPAVQSQVSRFDQGQSSGLSTLRVAARGCSRQIGPFATQDTAWQRWRQARAQGYPLSSGIFPCNDRGTRGYCFNAFLPC